MSLTVEHLAKLRREWEALPMEIRLAPRMGTHIVDAALNFAAWLLPRLGDAPPEPPEGRTPPPWLSSVARILERLRDCGRLTPPLDPIMQEITDAVGAASRARAPGAPEPSEAALCAEMLERIVAADAVGPYLRMDIARAAKCLRGAACSDDRALRDVLSIAEHGGSSPEQLLVSIRNRIREALAGAAPQ